MRLFLIIVLLLPSCALFVGGADAPKSAKESRYVVRFSRSAWVAKVDARSDYVFENADGRILLSNSFCDEFQEQPLDRLATKTFSSVSAFAETDGAFTTFRNREAYRLDGTGTVDGVRVSFRLLNTRRDNCYFDFLAISPAGTARDDAAFDAFLESVDFK
jgi:hypothetical protein